jgi:hypothetical protein
MKRKKNVDHAVILPRLSFPICTGASSIRGALNPKRTANSWSLWFRIQFRFRASALYVRHIYIEKDV